MEVETDMAEEVEDMAVEAVAAAVEGVAATIAIKRDTLPVNAQRLANNNFLKCLLHSFIACL